MPKELHPKNKRRAAVFAAMQPDANRSEVARRFGMTRRYLYTLIAESTKQPERKLAEAREEAEYRRRIFDLTMARR